jgi:flagellar biosynthesis component FlhA
VLIIKGVILPEDLLCVIEVMIPYYDQLSPNSDVKEVVHHMEPNISRQSVTRSALKQVVQSLINQRVSIADLGCFSESTSLANSDKNLAEIRRRQTRSQEVG